MLPFLLAASSIGPKFIPLPSPSLASFVLAATASFMHCVKSFEPWALFVKKSLPQPIVWEK